MNKILDSDEEVVVGKGKQRRSENSDEEAESESSKNSDKMEVDTEDERTDAEKTTKVCPFLEMKIVITKHSHVLDSQQRQQRLGQQRERRNQRSSSLHETR